RDVRPIAPNDCRSTRSTFRAARGHVSCKAREYLERWDQQTGATASFLAAQRGSPMFSLTTPISSEGGDTSFQNNVPDPVTSGKELPTFKFELEKSAGRVMGGSYGKEATVAQLPISKGIAGVSMR